MPEAQDLVKSPVSESWTAFIHFQETVNTVAAATGRTLKGTHIAFPRENAFTKDLVDAIRLNNVEPEHRRITICKQLARISSRLNGDQQETFREYFGISPNEPITPALLYKVMGGSGPTQNQQSEWVVVTPTPTTKPSESEPAHPPTSSQPEATDNSKPETADLKSISSEAYQALWNSHWENWNSRISNLPNFGPERRLYFLRKSLNQLTLDMANGLREDLVKVGIGSTIKQVFQDPDKPLGIANRETPEKISFFFTQSGNSLDTQLPFTNTFENIFGIPPKSLFLTRDNLSPLLSGEQGEKLATRALRIKSRLDTALAIDLSSPQLQPLLVRLKEILDTEWEKIMAPRIPDHIKTPSNPPEKSAPPSKPPLAKETPPPPTSINPEEGYYGSFKQELSNKLQARFTENRVADYPSIELRRTDMLLRNLASLTQDLENLRSWLKTGKSKFLNEYASLLLSTSITASVNFPPLTTAAERMSYLDSVPNLLHPIDNTPHQARLLALVGEVYNLSSKTLIKQEKISPEKADKLEKKRQKLARCLDQLVAETNEENKELLQKTKEIMDKLYNLLITPVLPISPPEPPAPPPPSAPTTDSQPEPITDNFRSSLAKAIEQAKSTPASQPTTTAKETTNKSNDQLLAEIRGMASNSTSQPLQKELPKRKGGGKHRRRNQYEDPEE